MTLYPWLEPVWQRLLKLTQGKRLGHAFLFYSPHGIGETALVCAFEQLLLCQTPTLEGACTICRSCYLYQQGHHPDLQHYQDDNPVGIDEIRQLCHFLEEASHQKLRKVVTLFDVDKLQTASGNALLKTLEEPIGETVVILVASKLTILPTLKSRCFVINVPTPSTQAALVWLKENSPEANADLLRRSLHFANGSPLIAMSLLANLTAYESMFQALLMGKACAFDSQEIQQLITSKPLAALYLIYYFLTDLLSVALNGETGVFYNEQQTKALDQLRKRVPLREVVKYSDKVNEAIRALTLGGVNKTLLFEALFCQWQLLCVKGKK